MEELTFTIDVSVKNINSAIEEVAGNGKTVKGIIKLLNRCWYLTLKGNGGAQTYWQEVPIINNKYDHNTTGSILKFKLYNYIDEDSVVHGEYSSAGIFEGEIYVKGTPSNGKIKDLQLWIPYAAPKISTGITNGYFATDAKPTRYDGPQPDVLDCDNVKYTFHQSLEEFEKGKNLYTLLGVITDEEEFFEKLEYEKKMRKKYAYDYGPSSNHKTPLRFKEWNGKEDGGYVEWDYYVSYAATAKLTDMNTRVIKAFKGIGDNPEITIMSIVKTRDGKDDSSDPMVRVKGSKGEVWFNPSTISMNSGNGDDDDTPTSVYIELYKIKDFKDHIIYEDLNADDEYISVTYNFTDESKTELDYIGLNFEATPLEVFGLGRYKDKNKAQWTIRADELNVVGDEDAYKDWWGGRSAPFDYFGAYLKRVGIEL